jgi:hypothetical protein
VGDRKRDETILGFSMFIHWGAEREEGERGEGGGQREMAQKYL